MENEDRERKWRKSGEIQTFTIGRRKGEMGFTLSLYIVKKEERRNRNRLQAPAYQTESLHLAHSHWKTAVLLCVCSSFFATFFPGLKFEISPSNY